MSRLLVTSALPYANGPIHFGHIAGAYLPADIHVRYQRLRGEQVLYICGTDEHGVAITLTAEQAGVTPQEQVDRWHAEIRRFFDRLDIDFDHFGRTTSPAQAEISSWFFKELLAHGWISKKSEKQYYDPKAGRWLPDRYIIGTCPHCGHAECRGDECPACGAWIDPTTLSNVRSKISGEPAELRETRHWYLDLDRIQPWLEQWLGTKKESWKPNVINKLFSDQLKEGLRARAITRDLEWGIPVPLDDPDAAGKVLYVWFDAPIGYISSTIEWAENKFGAGPAAEEAWRSWWQGEDVRLVHFIGKDNIPFHCLTFPGMLKGIGERIEAGARFVRRGCDEVEERPYILPQDVPANEFYNFQGGKFSTSAGWYIELDDFFSKYSADSARWCIARSAPETADSEWTWEFFQQTTNRELADVFGNLASRAIKFVHQKLEGTVPPLENPSAADTELLSSLEDFPRRVGTFLDVYRVKRAAQEVLELGHTANKYFNDHAPWKTYSTDIAACRNCLHVTLQVLRTLSVLLAPFVPRSAARLARQLGCRVEAGSWTTAGSDRLPAGSQLGEAEILFAKIPDKQIEAELSALHERARRRADAEKSKTMNEENAQPAASQDDADAALEPLRDTITFDDFIKLDIRTGLIEACEEVPKSKKLLELTVDIGLEKRQILAGVKQDFSPEELVGCTVLILANLAPRKMAGRESQGMMLAVNMPDGRCLRISPIGDARPGWQVS